MGEVYSIDDIKTRDNKFHFILKAIKY